MQITLSIPVETSSDLSKNFRPDASIRCILTTDHSASSYGQPVLVAEDGTAYGASDLLPGTRAKAWVAVTTATSHFSGSSEEFALANKFRMCDPIQAESFGPDAARHYLGEE
jgi:hypothetical protein